MQIQFQQIIDSLDNKKFEETILLCNHLLKSSNHPQLHLFLGIAYGQSGKLDLATDVFNNLAIHFPNNGDIFYNFALVLQKNNQYNNAIVNYKKCLAIQPQNFSAWNNMGEVYRLNKTYRLAIEAFTMSLKIQPENLTYIRNLGICLYQNNSFDEAHPLLLKTINTGIFEIEDGVAILDILITLRQLRHATDIGKIILNKYPNNEKIFNQLGLVELEKRKFFPAITYLKKALALNSNYLDALCHLSSAYLFSGNKLKASELLSAIVGIGSEPALVFACSMYETNNQSELTSKTVKEGLIKFPKSEELLFHKAKLFRKKKNFKESLIIINQILTTCDNNLKSDVLYEKGQLLNKTLHYTQAWEQFINANNQCEENWKNFNSQGDDFVKSCEVIFSGFEKINNYKRKQTKVNNSGKNLIFIVGFPRSGTTLLDSILSAHSDITVLEEAPVLGETYDQITNITIYNYSKKLSELSPFEIAELQDFYYNSLINYTTWNQRGVLVDKSPLNTMHIGLIHVLFPDAKIIFSLRHPLDVCTSCFFQNFKMNSFMTNMTSISKTAKTYSAMLSVWSSAIQKFNVDVRYQSYEELVTNFECQTKELILYLKLPWEDELLTYQNNLENRGAISTPSFNQVNQPIYQTAKNRYKNYIPYLDEAIDILKPWIKHFGYEI